MAAVRTVAVQLKAEVGSYVQNMKKAGAATQGLDTEVKKASRGVDSAAGGTGVAAGKMNKSLGGITSAAQGMSAGVALASATAGTAVVSFVRDSVDAASRLNEQISATETIFGDAADEIRDFGRSSSDIGIAESEALKAANAFGDLFTKIGYTDEAAATFSEDLVRMSADLASFKDLDPNDVLGKLKSGLSGESEPLKALGIFINEAAIASEGLKLGLTDANGEMGEGEKVAARLSLIMQGMGDAYGDVDRTADSYANTQRRASAEMEELKATLGQQFLPVLADGAYAFSELASALQEIGPATDSLSKLVEWTHPLSLLAKGVRLFKGDSEDAADASYDLGDSQTLLADSMSRSKRNVDDSTKAIEKQVDALEELLEATKSQFSSEIDYQQAVLGIQGDLEKYNESLRANKDGKADNDVSSRELQEQELGLRDALLGAGEAAVRQAEDHAKAAGKTLTESQKYDVFRDALLKLKEQFPQLGSRIDEYVTRLDKVPAEKRTTVGLTGWELAQARAQALADVLATIPSFKNVTVRYDEVLGTTVSRPGGGRVTERSANGNLFEQHTAQIAPGGAMRLWAEPETGGEAYIPLAPSKRARSLAIWEETGRRLEAFAIGGIRGMDFRDDAKLDPSQVIDLRGKKFNPKDAYWRTYLAQMQKYRNVRAFADGGFVGGRFASAPMAGGSAGGGGPLVGQLVVNGRADRETMLEVKHALTDVAFHA